MSLNVVTDISINLCKIRYRISRVIFFKPLNFRSMKSLLLRFADSLLSKEELKSIKGGQDYCTSQQGNVQCYIDNQKVGSVYGCCTSSLGSTQCQQVFGMNAYSQGCVT